MNPGRIRIVSSCALKSPVSRLMCPASLLMSSIVDPQTEPSEECVGVVAGPAARRQCLELGDVPAPDDDVFRLQRGDQAPHDVLDVAAPLRQPVCLQPAQADVILERPGAVWKMAH